VDADETAGAGAPRSADAGRVFSSVRWVAAGQIFSQGVRLAVSIALAHLLTPHDFGLATMAVTFTAVGTLLSTLGAGPAIVQRRTLPETLLRSLATLGLSIGLALWLAFALASGLIAAFYGEPEVQRVVIALAATFPLATAGTVPEGLLQRDLRFGRLVAIDLACLAVSSLGSVGLALHGEGVWALVVPNLASTGLRSALLLLSSPWRPRLGFDTAAIRGVIGFSSSVLGFNGLQYFARNSDNLVIGRALGSVELGLYDYAYRFYMYPLDAITGVLISVMFPALASLQDDREAMGRAFLRANGAIALATFPMMIGLAVVADPFVRVVLGEKWIRVIPLVQILSPMGALQSLTATPGQIFLATGNAALRMWWAVIYTTVIVASFVVGAHWGIIGVATAYAGVMVPISFVAFWLALRLVRLPMRALWATLAKTVAACAAMAAAVGAAEIAMRAAGAGDVALLVVCVPLGAAIYAAVVWTLRPDALADLVRLVPARFVPAALRVET
jgi:O-antigen/teichoic acid export membrane protein